MSEQTHLTIDVQDQVHLERLGFTMKSGTTIEFLSFGIDVLGDAKFSLDIGDAHSFDAGNWVSDSAIGIPLDSAN